MGSKTVTSVTTSVWWLLLARKHLAREGGREGERREGASGESKGSQPLLLTFPISVGTENMSGGSVFPFPLPTASCGLVFTS